jgi:hypothetical protein
MENSPMTTIEHTRRLLPALVLALPLVLSGGVALAQQSFTVLSYNVAGLPPAVAAVDVLTNIPLIADRLNSTDYSIIAIQEGFVHGFDDPTNINGVGTGFYDEITTSNATPGDFQTPPADTPSGGFLSVSSGLIRLSTSPFESYSRTKWDMLFGSLGESGSDAASDKGYSFARHEVAPEVFVDVYNLHADAGNDAGSIAARTDNIDQLITAINANSSGNAVIALGDFNSRYTDSNDVIRDLITPGGTIDEPLTDVWVELARGGSVPPLGPDLTSGCSTSLADGDCEDVDKIYYRSGDSVSLTADVYFVEDDFVDGAQMDLSDHYPTGAVFTVPEPGGFSIAALLTLAGLARRRSRAEQSS